MKQTEFYNRINGFGGVPRTVTRNNQPFVKRVYCDKCLTTHEEEKHLVKEVK